MSLNLEYLMPSREPWLKNIVEMGFPNSKDENFFYFPLVKLQREWNMSSKESSTPVQELKTLLDSLGLDDSPVLVLLDGFICESLSTPQLYQSVSLVDDYSAKQKERISSFHWDYLKMVSYQAKSSIYRIDTKELNNTKVNCVFLQTQAGTISTPHIFWELEKNKKLDISLYTNNLNNGPKLLIPYLYSYLEEQSHLNINWVLNSNTDDATFIYGDIFQEANSSLNTWVSFVKGNLSRIAISSVLNGEEAKVKMEGQYLTKKNEQLEIFTRVFHKKPNTFSDQLFKGVCQQGGHFSFNGDILVSKHAKGVEAYQLSKNIVTDKTSKVYTRPQLHVEHHELKCTHGATVGGIHPDELFYLQSRGISLEQAQNMAVLGFLEEITQKQAESALQKWVIQNIKQKLS